MFDAKAFSDAIVDSCKAFVSRSLEPLTARLDAIEAKAAAQVSVSSALIDRDGQLVLTMSDGTTKALGIVVGKDGDAGQNGADGNHGRDGLSLEHFDASLMDDGRTVVLSLDREDYKYEVELKMPVMLYRGVFAEGKSYDHGDTVTWGGSLWHCNTDGVTDKPGLGDQWTLAAKKGRDAK